MEQNLLQLLLIKYRNNELTAGERDTLSQLLHDPENESRFEQLASEGFVLNPEIHNDARLKKEIFSSILEKKNEPRVISPLRWIKWAAAASVIAVMSIGGYLWFNSGTTNNRVQNHSFALQVNDAAPGNDKAVLQLADGTTIVLDSADNGQLSRQGRSSIVKSNGELVYSPANDNIETAVVFNTMITPRGGQYRLTLADGTRVWLNSASTLRYPSGFSGKERRVELTGEAYFEVAKRASQPFHVQTGNMDVEVLGTHFNVNAYSNESQIRTTLIEGSVRVNINHANRAVLEPGQQAEVQRADINVVNVRKDVDVAQVIAWQSGFFKFRNADLSLIARQLSRWYDVDIETEGKLTELKLGGGISKQLQLSDVLTLLETSGAKYRWENGRVKLYSP